VRAGATPVFADIDPETLNLDPRLARDRVEQSRKQGQPVRAILPVHLYGQCADMTAFSEMGSEFGIAVVEDAAQAIGADWQGRRAGSLGIAAAFSFYPTKNLSAYGEAGIVTTMDLEVAEHMRRLRNHGSPRRYYHEEFGWNSRLDAIQAAVLRVKLRHVENWNEERRERAASYDRLFAEAGLTSSRADSPIRPLARSAGAKHIFHQYVIQASRRDDLRKFLAQRKIGSEVYYPVPLHQQSVFDYLGYKTGDFPVAERAAQEVLALPMFPELTGEEISRVVENIAEFYN
jgi:dTDP-4-amino-4,6-dideoxygalactose transaminase